MNEPTRVAEQSRDLDHSENDRDYIKWQRKLLSFMTRMVAALTLFFFLASFGQLIYLHLSIRKSPTLNLSESVSQLPSSGLTPAQMIEASKLKALIILEGHSSERQYHQANVLLMARVWTSYLGFVTGMVLALVGAAFILGKLREPFSELSTSIQATGLSLKSASPGLLLASLGTMLMLATIITHHQIDVVDKAIYLHDITTVTTAPITTQPPLDSQPKSDKKADVSNEQPPLKRPTMRTDNTTQQQPPLQRPSLTPHQTPASNAEQPTLQRPIPKVEPTPHD